MALRQHGLEENNNSKDKMVAKEQPLLSAVHNKEEIQLRIKKKGYKNAISFKETWQSRGKLFSSLRKVAHKSPDQKSLPANP